MLVFLCRLIRLLWKQIRDLFGESYTEVENWAIGIVRDPAPDLVRRDEFPPVEWLTPPEGRFFADPFGIVRDGLTYIFFEDYDYRSHKGR